ncbi:MAG: putative lipid II flippase FtsW [Desulfatibacillaceae bacterium]
MDTRPGRMQVAGYDWPLVCAVLLLVFCGLVMVYSASSAIALRRFGEEAFYVRRQIMFALFGGFLLIVLKNVPYTVYRTLAYPLLVLAFAMLVALMIPGLGTRVGGATRWFRLGPMSFQPAEFARFAVVVYLAYSMSKKGEAMADFAVGVLPHLLFTGILAGLMLMQPDFGSGVLLALITGFMLFLGGARLRHLGVTALAMAPFLIVFLLVSDYRMKRIMSFFEPDGHMYAGAYQAWHSLMAFGSGGISGVGIGAGLQKLFYLPEPHTDFVFAVLGEELGLWGVLFVLALYSIVIWRGLSLARRVPDLFATYLAAGLVLSIGLPAATNIAVTMKLLPTKGLTLPFLSYGGTSLAVSLACVGILNSIAAAHAPVLAGPKKNVKVAKRGKKECATAA